MNVDAQKNIAVRVQHFRQNTVIQFRGGDLQEGCRTELTAHLELPCSKAEGRGGDEVLYMEAGGRQPVPFKRKPFPIRVKDAVQQFQPFPAVQCFGKHAHHLEMVQGIGQDPGESGSGRTDILFLDRQDQELGFYKAIIALFQLSAEHLGVQLPDAVEPVPLGRDLDALHKILPVHVPTGKGNLHIHRAVVGIVQITESFKDSGLGIGLSQLIVHISKLDTSGPGGIVQLTQTVRVHLPERQGILGRMGFAVTPGTFHDPADFPLLTCSQFMFPSRCRLCGLLFAFEQLLAPPFPLGFAALWQNKNC